MTKNKCNEDCFNCPYDDCVKTTRDASYYREYYKTHKEAIMKSRKKYYEKNREKINAYRREWERKKREKNANNSKKQADNNGLSTVSS